MIGWNQEKSHFSNTGENLAKAGVFRWVTNIHEHKYYYTFDNSLHYLWEHSEHYTNLSALNHNDGFFRVLLGRWHIDRVRAKPCVHRFSVFPDTPAEGFPVRAVDT